MSVDRRAWDERTCKTCKTCKTARPARLCEGARRRLGDWAKE